MFRICILWCYIMMVPLRTCAFNRVNNNSRFIRSFIAAVFLGIATENVNKLMRFPTETRNNA